MTSEKQIRIDDTKFVVRIDHRGPYAIYERRLHARGTPYEAWYNAPRWHISSSATPRKGTVLMAVYEEALQQS